MDAKPQRIRVRGDENVPPSSFHTNKAIHQRNKSTSALNVASQGINNTRRAFGGDVSNTKEASRFARDDSALVKKPSVQTENKPVLSQPAQRPVSMSGLKGILNTVAAKPVNPAGKAQGIKVNKRNNAVFRDQLEPVAEKEASKEASTGESARVADVPVVITDAVVEKEKSQGSVSSEVNAITDCSGPLAERGLTREVDSYHRLEASIPVSDTTLSDDEEVAATAATTKYYQEPEDWLEYEEEDSLNMPPFNTRSDNTTGGTATVVYPTFNPVIKRELMKARKIVEQTRTEDEIIEDFYDSSMVAEYSPEIFFHLRSQEIALLPTADYMNSQNELQWSMRAVLMDWLVQVHFRFALLPETLFLCVNFIDRFLSNKIISLGKLQLVGATALFIASKYEEIQPPSVHEIVYMVDGGYTADEILKAERFMLNILNFDLGWPGPMSFLRRISKADDYDLETRTVAKYFLELTIMDERFVSTPPSFSSAGAHCLARLMLQKGAWTPAHAHYSGYIYSQLTQRHHQAIHEKYMDRRFKRASLFVDNEIRAGFTLPLPVSLTNAGRMEETENY
ncbi:G2/mitotic-specific cyclin-4 [Penicillium chermesinum]|nr:G2/mitotic-specific cyclin-4 [Penicillium chermesinum]